MGTVLLAFVAFGFGAVVYQNKERNSESGQMQSEASSISNDVLVREHSPVLGPVNAPVTIVEFFDPSCENCRAFYPTVKEILARYPQDVRVVLRYAPFHQGSDEAVAIIEAARKQNLFLPVLDILIEKQPEWAIHGAPDLKHAWSLAESVGLNVEKARQDLVQINVDALLEQDVADLRSSNVRGTPTFFINGKQLTSFGQDQLNQAVENEVFRLSRK